MKNSKDKKIPINSVLPEPVVYEWHKFAVENKLNKQKALAELIRRGAKVKASSMVLR